MQADQLNTGSSQEPALGPRERLEAAVRNVPDFPKQGIQFKDITPVLQDRELFQLLIKEIARPHLHNSIETVVGIDARGFILGSAVAYVLGAGFVPIRKKGKLPYQCLNESYTLEYGTNTVEMHQDALCKGKRVLLVDDLLATGGTALAAVNLLKRCGAEIQEIVFFIELAFLLGKSKFNAHPVRSIITYR